ncbi:MAG: hypothetical protein Q7T85_03950, partial [Nitrosomonas sp.]|nr:hypothetical protein [Nitrosomonas sp.]
HDENYFGDWGDITTVQIHGVRAENAEICLLNALMKYSSVYGIHPNVISMADWTHDVEQDQKNEIEHLPSAIPRDIEPLRCFYYARVNVEAMVSCLQYYRVLEYYAFFSLQGDLTSLRRDSSISDNDFLLEVSKMISREEKGPLIKLVAMIAEPSVITSAVSSGLISSPDSTALGTAIYNFRNSIVHAKYDQRAAMRVDSVVSPSSEARAWMLILERLAEAAIKSYASMLRL